jgi:hypothetical protein
MAIIPPLSADEIEKVTKQRKIPLPKYTSVLTGASTSISEDFEAYLILQPADKKQTILSWINTVKGLELDNTDRDDLLRQWMTIRAEEAALQIEELDEALGGFDEFKRSLTAGDEESPTRFAELVELDLLARALQKPIDELVMMRDEAFHEQNMILLIKNQLDNEGATTESTSELENWSGVIAAYPGQEGG